MNSISSDFILNCFNKDYSNRNTLDESINKYMNSNINRGDNENRFENKIGSENRNETKNEIKEIPKNISSQEAFRIYNSNDDKDIVIKFSLKNIIIAILLILLIVSYYYVMKYKNKLQKYKHMVKEPFYNQS